MYFFQRNLKYSSRFINKKYFCLLHKLNESSRLNNIAIIDSNGQSYTYKEINNASSNLVQKIYQLYSNNNNHNHSHNNNNLTSLPIKTIASFHNPSAFYVITSLASWKIGATVVPLSISHTENELEYFLLDSNTDLIITTSTLLPKLPKLNIPYLLLDEDTKQYSINSHDSYKINKESNALIVYTSGTTNKPKGVVHTHNSLHHMILSLTSSWEYNSNDRILHFLPLHHLHGILNKLWCVLYSGGIVEFLKSTNPIEIWKRLSDSTQLITLFMAVPTIYIKLLESYDKKDLPIEIFQKALENIKSIRLMVSGSASLHVPVLYRWRTLTGHTLLERYGMTEVGMALTNPIHGERKEGYVGSPLPFVQCKIIPDFSYSESHKIINNNHNNHNNHNHNNHNKIEHEVECEEFGELLLKGPTIFKEYYNRPNETKDTFDSDGWFKTGDIALKQKINGHFVYRILGRNSVDIIKFGGYKLSALEIERELLSYSEIQEAVVIGKEDEMYGHIVVGIVVLTPNSNTTIDDIQQFLKSRLAPYKLPKILRIVTNIPKNQLGKINKKTLWKDLENENK